MSATNVQSASETYLRLKNERGHWHSEEHKPDIDNFNGERHLAMIELQKHLGLGNTPADDIQRLMGTPTKVLSEPDLVLQHEFRQQDPPFQYPADAQIWIYEWRNFHDYVYFVLSKEKQVIHSAWYHAYE